MKCLQCGRDFEKSSAKGPTPQYCQASCRQRAYEARWRPLIPQDLRKPIALIASRQGIPESEVAVSLMELGMGVIETQEGK